MYKTAGIVKTNNKIPTTPVASKLVVFSLRPRDLKILGAYKSRIELIRVLKLDSMKS